MLILAARNEALIEASGNGNVYSVVAALDAGANVGAVDGDGNSALHRACSGGHGAVVNALLDAGADPMAPGAAGFHPLHIACLACDQQIVAMLLLAGAELVATTASGLTARDVVIENGHQDCVDVIDRHLGESGRSIVCSQHGWP